MIHIHRHDSYSQLDGVGTPTHYARLAAEMGHVALAQSNHGNLNGALSHRKACQKEGLIPICAIEAYWRPNRHVRDKEWRYRRWHLVLLAKNLRGWHNLIRLSSESFASGFYQDPCVDWDLQERYAEGVICTTSCVLGPLPYLIQNGTDAHVDEWVERALRIYGDDLYFAVHPHDTDQQRAVNLAVVSIANRHGCPVVYEGDSHYPEPGWEETQKVAILVGMSKTFADAEREARKRIEEGLEAYELWHDGLHLMGEPEVRARFASYHPDLPCSVVDEAIRSTDEIAAKVDPYLIDRSIKMPRATRTDDEARETVMAWCREGMERVGKAGDPVYEERLDYEARVIDGRQAFAYFALVGDVVRWARTDEPLPRTNEDADPSRKRPIRINSGRGSAAASLVCYLARITMLDPIAHKFKFERFLNPERHGLPDIDIDVASTGRALIKEYVARKYGRESVADIVAQQHFQPRAALQSVTRTMYGYGSDAYRQIAVLTHYDTGVIDPVYDSDLEAIREREPGIDSWARSHPEVWEHARRLENGGDPSVMRLSKHAGAVAIVPGKVTDHMPTIRADEDEVGVRTAWAETTRISVVEEIGVVKVDFLALKGMDQQQKIVDSVAEHTGLEIDLDALSALRDPYDVDPDVMDAFQRGLNLGVNQFQGDGVTEFMRRARPENIVDLTAINALYRPGPLGSGGHNRYVKRKRGDEPYELPEVLQAVLGDTYSSICFQEQVMELFEVLAGYTPGQADGIRKIIAKLYRDKTGLAAEELDKHRAAFVEAATERVGVEVAERLWEEVLPYSGYSFNRPHAGSYSVQALQDQWLKVRYPLDFYAALLSMEDDKTQLIMREGRHFGVKVLPPDVNRSEGGFTVDREAEGLRYGLLGIKGVGDAATNQILEDRPFDSLDDLERRCSRKYTKVGAGVRKALLRSGAFDGLGGRSDWTARDRALAEMELLGVALEPGGLLGEDAPLVREHVYSEQEVADLDDGDRVVVGGSVSDVRTTTVKRGKQRGQEMAFVRLSLDLDAWSITCFPDVWSASRDLVYSGEMVMFVGRKDDRGSIIASQAMALERFVEDLRSEQERVAA